MSKALLIGVHAVDNGGIHMAALRAGAAGARALQIFTAPPKFYGERAGVKPEKAERFRAALKQAGIAPEHVMAHGAYVLGVATPDPAKWARASAGLSKELERSVALGIGSVCFHPGSATDGDRDAAAERVARAITAALKAVQGPTRLLVENSAGAGQTFGRSAAEVRDILAQVPDALRERTGYGLDSCHMFASGYDIAESEAAQRAILDEWESTVGEAPAFFHLNDSEGALGSNRDRHMLIGEGQIGSEPFQWLLRDSRSRGIPLILETPHAQPDLADDDPSADPYEVRMIALLREFAG